MSRPPHSLPPSAALVCKSLTSTYGAARGGLAQGLARHERAVRRGSPHAEEARNILRMPGTPRREGRRFRFLVRVRFGQPWYQAVGAGSGAYWRAYTRQPRNTSKKLELSEWEVLLQRGDQ